MAQPQESRAEPSKSDCDKKLIEEQNGSFIQTNRLIQLKCKSRGSESIKCIAFWLFSKYMNKWLITKENKFLWSEGGTKAKVCVFVMMMLKHGSSYWEAKLEKDGDYATHHIYCVWPFSVILMVENELVES